MKKASKPATPNPNSNFLAGLQSSVTETTGASYGWIADAVMCPAVDLGAGTRHRAHV